MKADALAAKSFLSPILEHLLSDCGTPFARSPELQLVEPDILVRSPIHKN